MTTAQTRHEDFTAELLAPEIAEMIASGDHDQARAAFEQLLDVEVADVLVELEPDQRPMAIGLLPGPRAADIFDYLEQDDQEALVEALNDEQVAEIFNQMDPDDRVDFLEDAPDAVAESTLALMDPAERSETRRILEYPEQTVGRLMTTEFFNLRPECTAAQALDHIRKHGHEAETLHILYLIEDGGRLIDHIRLRHLVLAEPEARLESLREGHVVKLNALDDREEAVRTMERYDLPVLPVVDGQNVMVGIVTFDDVADVAEEEATEDIHKIGGMEALDQSYFATTIPQMARKRGIWLLLLFFGGLLTVTAMGFFHGQLEQKAILALFVPLIIASGGNSGSQAATLIIRALAVNQLKTADWWRIFQRELLSGLLLGTLLGLLGLIVGGLVAYLGPGDANGIAAAAAITGFAIGTAIVGVVLTGILTGAMLPLALEAIGLDPATCSTPFVATIVDVAGLVIYFSVAMIILGL